MFRDLFPLLAALALAAAVYGWRERRRKHAQVRPPFPDIDMAQAWAWWLEGRQEPADLAMAPPGADSLAVRLHPQALAGLLETEHRCLASEHPRIGLRQAMLDGATLGLYLEALLDLGDDEREALLQGYQAGMEDWLRDATVLTAVHWLVLRQYSRWKYDDAVEDDWFQRFYRTARPYLREKVRLAREYLVRTDAGSLRLVEIYDQLLQELVQRSLTAAPKRRFARPDLR